MPSLVAKHRCLCSAAVALWLTSAPARAQIPDLIDVGAQYTPGEALADPRPTKAQITTYEGTLNVPIPLGDSTFLIPGAAYRGDAVSFENTPPGFIDVRGLHSAELTALFVQLLPHDWALSLRVAGGLAGDFESVDSGMLRMSGVALATHAFSETFTFGGGGLVNYAFGSVLPLPALYVDIEPTPGLTIEAFIPAFARVTLAIEDRVELGYRVEVQGNAYAIRDERIAGAAPCVAGENAARDPSACLDHIAYSSVIAGPTVAVRLFSTVWASAMGGHTPFRRFEMMNADGDAVPGGVQALPQTWMFRSNLTWRVPMP